jgi:dethiobiotin synthetase
VSAGVFVTGTDTGVGKTLVACALVRELVDRGMRVGAMKPIETGVGPQGPLDAQALQQAAGGRDPLERVCPERFALPAAPSVAARAEGREVRIGAIVAAFRRLIARYELVVVEGAGGLLVPLDATHTMADLAATLELPLLVVARGALGTINHTRLTLEAAEARGVPVLGVVVSHAGGVLSDADAENLADLRDWLGDRLLGEIPPLPSDAKPPAGCLRVDTMLERLGALEPLASVGLSPGRPRIL